MNRRTGLLLAAALGIGVLYAIDSGYRGWIEEPTQRLEVQLAATEQKLADLQAEQVAARRMTTRLDDYAGRALPYDPALARSHYREWLLHLVEKHGMTSASVNAEPPRPIELRGRVNRRQSRLIGHSIRVTVRARTTLPHLVDFFHDFERSAQLHKILGFSLNPLGNGSQLDATLSIEALSLEASEREEALSDWVLAGEAERPRENYVSLARRNVFARGFSESLGQVRLRAITRNRDGEREAWFAVGSPARTQIVGDGGRLDLPLYEIAIDRLDAGEAMIRVNDLPLRIELGQTIGEVLDPNGGRPRPVGQTAASAGEPEASSGEDAGAPGEAGGERPDGISSPPESAEPLESDANEETPVPQP